MISQVKRLIPKSLVQNARKWLYSSRIRKAGKAFDNAGTDPEWLGREELEALQEHYESPSAYGYDEESTARRGQERAARIMAIFKKHRIRAQEILELGCWDGMVSSCLQGDDREVTAIDLRADGFDRRARERGVRCLEMDAEQLEFDDQSFDFVFSYDALEHFADPEAVLREAIRVARRGGYVYLVFGPLYMSPMGLHAYYSISVPYCHILFEKSRLNDFIRQRNLQPIDFNQLNSWNLHRYRLLWQKTSDQAEVIFNYENLDVTHLDLIERFPSCFKSSSPLFDNFVVKSIEVLMRRTR